MNLMILMFDSGEEFPHLPLWGIVVVFMGVLSDLPTPSCTVCVEGVIVFVLDWFPFVESEVTHEEFPPIVVSPRTYFQKICLPIYDLRFI